ncbi:hypothetical protein HAX54_047870, partial [Datura stramonium]|nr:hypothetical protein [Datura stramonium]
EPGANVGLCNTMEANKLVLGPKHADRYLRGDAGPSNSKSINKVAREKHEGQRFNYKTETRAAKSLKKLKDLASEFLESYKQWEENAEGSQVNVSATTTMREKQCM